MLLEILTTIILHNSLDKTSRDFVSTIPKDADVQIIDWYQDDTGRFSYTGPQVSAFPTAIINLPSTKELGTLRQPKTWQEVLDAQAQPEVFEQKTDLRGRPVTVRKTPCETITNDGDCIGGQKKAEAQALKDSPLLSPEAKQAIEETITKIEAAEAQESLE